MLFMNIFYGSTVLYCIYVNIYVEICEYSFNCRYEPFVVAETSMPSTSGNSPAGDGGSSFNTLAGYLFGKNKDSEKMAMTTPVFSDSDGKMQFVVKARKVTIFSWTSIAFYFCRFSPYSSDGLGLKDVQFMLSRMLQGSNFINLPINGLVQIRTWLSSRFQLCMIFFFLMRVCQNFARGLEHWALQWKKFKWNSAQAMIAIISVTGVSTYFLLLLYFTWQSWQANAALSGQVLVHELISPIARSRRFLIMLFAIRKFWRYLLKFDGLPDLASQVEICDD